MTEQVTGVTVGQVAERYGVTVRTLHHYDEIGLLRPSRRSAAGYRLYGEDDLTRLRHVVLYRRLGFALEEVALLLDDPDADVVEHLRRQRRAVMSRRDEMQDLVVAIDRALEAEMSGVQLTESEKRELFGEGYSEEYEREARERWGDTEAWAQSQRRTAQYTKQDWQEITAEGEAVAEELAAAKRAGEPPTSTRAMDAAEAARQHIHTRFYDCPPSMHRCLGDLYVDDERFARYYDDREPGLAGWVRDAVHADAERQEG